MRMLFSSARQLCIYVYRTLIQVKMFSTQRLLLSTASRVVERINRLNLSFQSIHDETHCVTPCSEQRWYFWTHFQPPDLGDMPCSFFRSHYTQALIYGDHMQSMAHNSTSDPYRPLTTIVNDFEQKLLFVELVALNGNRQALQKQMCPYNEEQNNIHTDKRFYIQLSIQRSSRKHQYEMFIHPTQSEEKRLRACLSIWQKKFYLDCP